MIRKSFAILIVFLLMLGSIPADYAKHNTAMAESLTEVPAGYIGVYSAEDLNNVRNNLSGKYILMNDIDLTAATSENGTFANNGLGWRPIGTKGMPFAGIFDGNGYKIIGLKQSIKSGEIIYAGLFGYVKNGKIMNLGMENSSIAAENTSMDSATAITYAGGIIGYGYNVTISNSFNTGSVTADSVFEGFAGGIAGFIESDYSQISSVSDSYNAGPVKGKSVTGGLAGETKRVKFTNVYNTGALNGTTSDATGGIVGDLFYSSSITNAYNSGPITFLDEGAGIAGYSVQSRISNSHNEGEMTSTASSSTGGGIVGYAYETVVSKTYNSGRINSSGNSSEAGGIVGYTYNKSSISESYNTGDITAIGNVGGIAARLHGSSVANQTYNTGTITGNYSGGISGSSSSGTIQDSFNIGHIYGKYDMGGITGFASNGTIKRTYNAGLVTSTYKYSSSPGGIAGDFDGVIENSFFLEKVNLGVGDGVSDGTFKVSFDQLKDQGTFQGFDFTSIWKIDGTADYLFASLSQLPLPQAERNIDISMASLPEKTQYIQGETLNVTGAAITVKTNHGKVSTIAVTPEMVTGFDTSRPGNQTIKVTYDGLETSFNVSIKAKYTVTFFDYDGTVLKREEVVVGESATAPEPPVHEGRTFTSWDGVFTNVRDDLWITAKYNIHSHTLTYKDGNGVLFTETYQYGSTAKTPSQPHKEGYAFLNWYEDSEFQTQYPFGESVTSDITLYAKFAKIPDTPLNVNVVNGLDYLKVTWSPVSGADGYSIWWTTSPNEYFNGTYIESQNTEYTIFSLEPGKTYYVKVAAYRKVDGFEIGSWESQLVTGKTVLAGVTSPKAAVAGYNKVKLTWGKSSDATGYVIYQADSATGTFSPVSTITYNDTLSYTDSGLTSNKTYYYKIRAYRTLNGTNYYSSYSSVISANPVLAGTTAKAATAGYDKVKVTWTKSSEATGYEIHRAASSSGSYSKVATITSNSTVSYTNSGLTTGRSYYYKIRAYKTVGGKNIYSSFSSETSAVPSLSTITAKASTAGYNKIKVSWTKVSGAHGYYVYRATSKTGTYSYVGTINSGSILSYINSSLSTGKTYFYKVKAYRVVNSKKYYSPYSSMVSAVPVLAVPSKITLSKVSSTSIKASWYKVSEASGYELYRATSRTGTYSKVRTITSGSTISYTNTSLTRGKTYYYKVRAYKTVSGKKIYSSFTNIVYYKL